MPRIISIKDLKNYCTNFLVEEILKTYSLVLFV